MNIDNVKEMIEIATKNINNQLEELHTSLGGGVNIYLEIEYLQIRNLSGKLVNPPFIKIICNI